MFGFKKIKEENTRLEKELKTALWKNVQNTIDIKQKNSKIKELEDRVNLLSESVKLEESCKFEAEENLEKLAKKYKKMSASLGGLTKEINKIKKENKNLKLENKNLNVKLEDSMSDKYLVRKLPAQKSRVIQKTRLKNRLVNSSAKEILKSKSESEEKDV